jgi:hypothetical protein
MVVVLYEAQPLPFMQNVQNKKGIAQGIFSLYTPNNRSVQTVVFKRGLLGCMHI